MVNGIDVSAWQPNTDWTAVRDAGYSFAYVKRTEGMGYSSKTFDSDWSALTGLGMLRGSYHKMDWSAGGAAQAQYFLSLYIPSTGDLAPMLDVEYPLDESGKVISNQDGTLVGVTPQQAVDKIAAFLQVVEATSKGRCLLYLGYFFWRDALDRTDGFSGHPLWLADYVADAQEGDQPPLLPPVWSTWTIWQYSQSKTVPGVGTPCDADWFNGDVAALKQLALP